MIVLLPTFSLPGDKVYIMFASEGNGHIGSYDDAAKLGYYYDNYQKNSGNSGRVPTTIMKLLVAV